MKAAFGKTAVLAMFGLSVLLFQNCGASNVKFNQDQKASETPIDVGAFDKDERGLYRGFTVSPDGQETMFIETAQILRSESYENCKLNAANNSNLKVRCYFNDELILDNSKGSTALLGSYRGYMISKAEMINFITTSSISKADAKSNCISNAKQNSGNSFICYWNDEEIFRN